MADDPKAGTADDQEDGGTVEESAAGTPADDSQGGTEGALTPEQIKEIQEENARLKLAHEQSLGEKSELERLRRERAERPPTPDPSIQTQIDRKQEQIMALRRAAEQGDPVAQRMIDFERETVENLQFQQIPEAERDDVRKFYGQYRDRFADPQAAMYALRGVKAEFDQRNAKPPEKATAVPPQAKPRVATAARDAGPVAGKNDKMAFSEYLRAINKGGPEAQKLMADKDAGLKELDYSK